MWTLRTMNCIPTPDWTIITSFAWLTNNINCSSDCDNYTWAVHWPCHVINRWQLRHVQRWKQDLWLGKGWGFNNMWNWSCLDGWVNLYLTTKSKQNPKLDTLASNNGFTDRYSARIPGRCPSNTLGFNQNIIWQLDSF